MLLLFYQTHPSSAHMWCPHGIHQVWIAQPSSHSNTKDMQHAPHPHRSTKYIFFSLLTIIVPAGSPKVSCGACDPFSSDIIATCCWHVGHGWLRGTRCGVCVLLSSHAFITAYSDMRKPHKASTGRVSKLVDRSNKSARQPSCHQPATKK